MPAKAILFLNDHGILNEVVVGECSALLRTFHMSQRTIS